MSKLSIRSRTRLSVSGAAIAVPLALALAACGASSPSASAPASAPASSAPAAPVATAPAVKVPKYVAADNARKYVAAQTCKQDGRKGWQLKGTVTNSSSAARGYSIVVDFVATKGNTVLDTKVVHVHPVAPRSSAHWSALGAAGQANVTCVIRQALAS